MREIILNLLSNVALRIAMRSLAECSYMGIHQPELKDDLKKQMELLKGETGGKV